jgi:uncharacterized NAD(P)/FAD-binding protein YdhS
MNSAVPPRDGIVFDVAIIGGGASGALLTAQLGRQNTTGRKMRVALIERSERLGRGVAYSTTCAQHKLNVPAGNMSALPDEPDDFVAWVKRRDPSVTPDRFVARQWYGEYLNDTLERFAPQVELTRVRDTATDVSITDTEAAVHLASGGRVAARRVVLAGANYPPQHATSDPTLLSSPRYRRDPWDGAALAAVHPDDSLLLIGTGLTAIDVVLELHARGHRGEIHAISRRGLLPQPHRPPGKLRPLEVPPEMLQAPRTVVGYLRAFRRAMERAAKLGHDWRDVVASIRSITPRLWERLGSRQRRRFLRHLRPYWDTHRHRVAPELDAVVQSLREAGRLRVYAGRIARVAASDDSIAVTVAERGGGAELGLRVQWVLNCTGPSSDLRRSDEPLWQNLLRRGWVQPDEFGLGLLTSPEGAVLTSAGAASGWLYAMGPLRKAQRWENVAIPELRVEAQELAKRLIALRDAAEMQNEECRMQKE